MPAHKTTWAQREARFWSNVDKDGGSTPEHRADLGACWPWKLRKNNRGYGMLTWHGIGTKTSHAAAWFFTNGLVPEGLELDHLCRNRICARPDHLELVTRQENCRRSEPFMRSHCLHGHERSAENTYTAPDGRRSCRRCSYETARAKRQADPAAWAAKCRERRRIKNDR